MSVGRRKGRNGNGRRYIVRDNVDAVHLCKSLRGHGDKKTLLVARPHFGVGAFAFGAHLQDVRFDLAEFIAGTLVVDVAAGVEVGNDLDTFFVVVVVE